MQIFFPIWRLSFFVVYFLPYGNSTSMSTNVSIFSYGFWVLGHVLKDLPQFRNINVCSCLSSNFMAAYFISKYFVHLKFILISKLFVVVSASFPEQSIFFFYWDVKSLSWTKFQDAFSFISVLFVVLIAPFLQYILLSSRRTTPLLPMPLSLFFKKFLKFLQDFFPNEIEYYFTKLLTNPQIYWY